MSEYMASRSLADRLIEKKGRAIVVRRLDKTEPDNAWEQPIVVNDDHDAFGVFIGKTLENRDGTIIQKENETVLVAALNLSIVPTTEDLIIDGAVTRVIAAVEPTKPGAEDVLFSIELK